MKYLLHIEGLNREVWQPGESLKAARKALWDALPDEEKDRVVQIECVDECEDNAVRSQP